MQALRLINTNDISHDEWLDTRRTGIGGSDVSAICNMNRYRSPMAVYLDKIGDLAPVEDNEFMYWGRVLEEVVAQEFQVRAGLKIRRNNFVMRHKDYPWMLANIDRWVVGENAGLEVKTASEWARNDWIGETVPKEYALQCHHYMSIMGAERWFLCVLIGGNKFEWRVIERDEEIIESLVRLETEFWQEHVLKRVPPAFGAHDERLLSEMYPQSNPDVSIDLTPFRDEVLGLIQAKNDYEDAKFTLDDKKNQIKGLMGESEVAWFNDAPSFTWKSNSKGIRSFKFVGGKE